MREEHNQQSDQNQNQIPANNQQTNQPAKEQDSESRPYGMTKAEAEAHMEKMHGKEWVEAHRTLLDLKWEYIESL